MGCNRINRICRRLSGEKVATIYEAPPNILNRTGVFAESQATLTLLCEEGAKANGNVLRDPGFLGRPGSQVGSAPPKGSSPCCSPTALSEASAAMPVGNMSTMFETAKGNKDFQTGRGW